MTEKLSSLIITIIGTLIGVSIVAELLKIAADELLKETLPTATFSQWVGIVCIARVLIRLGKTSK